MSAALPQPHARPPAVGKFDAGGLISVLSATLATLRAPLGLTHPEDECEHPDYARL
jgi:hypothetical protein